ncbi:hypothetical protein F511_37478 [Dorcoceras hygrometricum]|uniref:Uncharacterized protein n=1 Tax=Dorcoceras hygrometricum TaxID=472368 RepID=A0A2Z7A0P6_9LAMI|nr:hypothetical protein F511_37478 [Dorcoceras hygrometricum]
MYAAICLRKFGVKSPISPLLPDRNDPLEDLILHLVCRPDPTAVKLQELLSTNAHQLAVDLNDSLKFVACTPAHTWVHDQLAHQLPHECASCD